MGKEVRILICRFLKTLRERYSLSKLHLLLPVGNLLVEKRNESVENRLSEEEEADEAADDTREDVFGEDSTRRD